MSSVKLEAYKIRNVLVYVGIIRSESNILSFINSGIKSYNL
jgi:hypothetical protein